MDVGRRTSGTEAARIVMLFMVGLPAQAVDPENLLERHDSGLCQHGCTLTLSAADLMNRKYSRLWRSIPHWKEWQRLGADSMRRIRQPQWFKGGEVVIDIGSYIGADLVSFLRHAPPNVSVHTFEPVAAYRTKLARRVRALVHSGRDRLQVHPYGLGGSEHTACFASSRAAATDEVRAHAGESKVADASCDAQIRDAAAALRAFTRIDVMQINCEGCEYAVLERLIEQPAALSVVHSLEVQFHLDWGIQNDTARYCRIENGLRSQGYRIDYRHPFLWERWTRRPCNHQLKRY
jgi:FkbM family methyltransferase